MRKEGMGWMSSSGGKRISLVVLIIIWMLSVLHPGGSEGLAALVKVEFVGAKRIPVRRLMKAVMSEVGKELDPDIVEDDLEEISQIYKDEGFIWAKVSYRVVEDGHGTTLLFEISEGKRAWVRSIDLEGNRAVGKKEIMDVLGRIYERKIFGKHYYNEKELKEAVNRIESLYRALGYTGSKISWERSSDSRTGAVDIVFKIEEGSYKEVGGVEILGASEEEVRKWAEGLRIREGMPFREDLAIRDKYDILLDLLSLGYIWATVDMEEVEREPGKVYLIYRVQKGPLTRFGHVRIRGNVRVKEKTILREIGDIEGKTFSYKKVSELQRALYSTGLFSRVSIDPDPSSKGSDVANLVVTVVESKPKSATVRFGYLSGTGPRISASASHNDLNGAGRKVGIDAKADGTGWRISSWIVEPWFLVPKLSLQSNIYAEKTRQIEESYSISGIGTSIGLSIPLGKEIKLMGAYKRDFLMSSFTAIGELGVEKVGEIMFLIQRDTRSDLVQPQGGSHLSISFERSSRLLGGDIDFAILKASMASYWRIMDDLVLALSGRVGLAKSYGDYPVPIFKRFFAGGGTTIRGYQEETIGPSYYDPFKEKHIPLGGEGTVILNAEIRFPIWKVLRGVVFLDCGNVWDKARDIDLRELKWSLGCGLRLLSPAGPMRLDFGYKLMPREWEGRTRFHFSFGEAF